MQYKVGLIILLVLLVGLVASIRTPSVGGPGSIPTGVPSNSAVDPASLCQMGKLCMQRIIRW